MSRRKWTTAKPIAVEELPRSQMVSCCVNPATVPNLGNSACIEIQTTTLQMNPLERSLIEKAGYANGLENAV